MALRLAEGRCGRWGNNITFARGMCPGRGRGRGKGEDEDEVRGVPVAHPKRRWANTRSEQHGTEGQESIIQSSTGNEDGHSVRALSTEHRAEHRATSKRGSFRCYYTTLPYIIDHGGS